MATINVHGVSYLLPSQLTPFQLDLYVHLINWKWKNITKTPGIYGGHKYDAILPTTVHSAFPLIYSPILPLLKAHLTKFPFRIHQHFYHMASSQAANINLFLPVLSHAGCNSILSSLKPDFGRLATSELDNGYRIEFWDEPYGNLNDKTNVSGTDSDIAIAYYNKNEELCLWLIEHKLTEKEFTTCGGYRSKGNKSKTNCKNSFSTILTKKELCYYHKACGFKYWALTDKHKAFFPNHTGYAQCPFKEGLNQLWRNQLLGLSIESDKRQPFKEVYFSVVRHPQNKALDSSINEYSKLINGNPKFSAFTSEDVINSARSVSDPVIQAWVKWYCDLYKV